MKKRVLLFCTTAVLLSLNLYAANYALSFPEGWQNRNMKELGSETVWKCANEEIIAIPPYYYLSNPDDSYWKTSANIITTIVGFFDPNSGWMVKSRGQTNNTNTTTRGDNDITYVDYVDIVGGWNGAFKGCTNTKKIILPPTITSIQKMAFDGCNLEELVCMAVTPPQIEEETFSNMTIGKVVVPTGTKSTYEATNGWNTFTIVEGADNYSDNQMVEYNGAWYEVVNGEASLINSNDMTDSTMPLTINCLIKGEWKDIPVNSIRSWSIGHDVVLNTNISEIPENFRDGFKNKGSLSVSDNNPSFLSPVPNVLTSKNGKIAYYLFNEAIVPHGVTTISNNALRYCEIAYLPTTVSYIGQQSITSAILHFTSQQPPSTTMTKYSGSITAPKEYLNNYNDIFSASESSIPAGYEYVGPPSSSGSVFVRGFWNVKLGTCILLGHEAYVADFDNDGVLNLPSNMYYTETMQGPIEEYRLSFISNKTARENITEKIRVPEGVKRITRLVDKINELYLPSTLEHCCSLSEIKGLRVIIVAPGNIKYDSRDNCNALIETSTNTLVTGNCGTTFPNSIEHIGDGAFYYASELPETLMIPNNIKSIGKRAFSGIKGETVKYQSTPIQVSFAASSTITHISDSAFYNSSINKIVLPNSVSCIGACAFESCYNLGDITFGNSLKEIGEKAFYSTKVKSLSFPDALEVIGDYAFYGIPTLETIAFGASLKEIGESAFSSCALSELSLPNSIRSIGSFAFSNASSLQTISFGSLLQSIGEGAFRYCVSLQSLSLPNSIKTIGAYAFEGCYNIQSLEFPMDSLVSIGREALYTCPAPEKLHLPYTLISMGEDAFNLSCLKELYTNSPTISTWNLTTLEKVVIGNHKKNTDVFSGCSNLTEVLLGDSVETIVKNAFMSIPITNIRIPKSLKNVGRGAFTGCQKLQKVEVTDLESWCSINFESGNDSETTNPLSLTHKLWLNGEEIIDLIIPDGVNKISHYCFEGCTNLTSLTIPTSVDTIGYMAFGNCDKLERINIKGLKNWCELTRWYNSFPRTSHKLFMNGEEIKHLVIPEGVDSINSYSFYKCDGLLSIILPNSVTKICNSAFSGCCNVERIELGDNVSLIEQYAFADFTNLKEFVCYSRKVPQCETNWVDKMPKENVTLYIPAGTNVIYNMDPQWKGFGQVVEMVDDRAIIVTANNCTMIYGSDMPYLTYNAEGGILSGTPDISCDISPNTPVGEYTIVVSKGSIENPNVTFVNGKLTINKAPLTIKAGDYTKKQGEDNPTFTATYEGFKNNETEEVLTTKPTISCEATKDSPVGEYEITVSGAEATNYEISYVNGKLTIEEVPVAIKVTVNNCSRIYGEANPAFEYTVEGGELIGTPTITCEATATSPVGTYTITIAKGDVTNENVTFMNGTLTITKAPLTIKAGDYTKKQGEDNPKFTATYEGFKNNETEEVLTTKPTISCEATKDSPVGEYAVTVSGAEAENYEISYVNGKLTIEDAPVAITVTVNNCSRIYGEANPAFEYTVEGGELIGTPTITCEATATSSVGTYTITIAKGDVTNENVTFMNGTLTITKAPLTIKAGDYTKKQGEDNPKFTATYEGFKNNETEEVLTTKPTISCEATKDSSVGEYAITVSGAEAENYEISYVNGKLTIEAVEFVSGSESGDEKDDAATYQITNTGDGETPPTVAVTDAGNASGVYEIPETVEHNGVTYTVTEIAAGAMEGNTNVTDVTIPSTITSIGDNAFAGCSNLKSITVNIETPIDLSSANTRRTRGNGNSVFEGVDKESCILYVPENSVELYKNAVVWKDFKNILAIGCSGISGIISSDGKLYDVYDLRGQKVKARAANINDLPKGIYIVNGKKLVLK